MDINQICQMTTNPQILNALHACRPDHPLNKTADRPFRNALFLARQNHDIGYEAIGWLTRKSNEEAGA